MIYFKNLIQNSHVVEIKNSIQFRYSPTYLEIKKEKNIKKTIIIIIITNNNNSNNNNKTQ